MTSFGSRSPLEWALLQLRAWVSPGAAVSRSRFTRVIGHRGAPRERAENTWSSLQAALSHGADGVEVDVCVTRDGHAVLWHDRDPDHWSAVARQNGLEACAYVPRVPGLGSELRKPIAALGLEQFLASAGYVASDAIVAAGLPREVPAETLSSLGRMLAREPRAQTIMLDVKLAAEEAALVPALVASLARVIGRSPALRRRCVQLLCAEREVYRALAASLQDEASLRCVRLCADFELPGVVSVARELGATDVSIGITTRLVWPRVREEILEALRARDQGAWRSVTVWTANRQEELRDLFAAGVDAVLTDDVPLARSVARALDRAGQVTTSP